MDLAFTVSSDRFTAEQNPAITVKIVEKTLMLKGNI